MTTLAGLGKLRVVFVENSRLISLEVERRRVMATTSAAAITVDHTILLRAGWREQGALFGNDAVFVLDDGGHALGDIKSTISFKNLGTNLSACDLPSRVPFAVSRAAALELLPSCSTVQINAWEIDGKLFENDVAGIVSLLKATTTHDFLLVLICRRDKFEKHKSTVVETITSCSVNRQEACA